MYASISICKCIKRFVFLYSFSEGCMFAGMYLCMYVCMYLCIYVCMYVCMSIYLFVCTNCYKNTLYMTVLSRFIVFLYTATYWYM